MSQPVTRTGAAFSEPNAFSLTVAMISADTLNDFTASCTTNKRPVFLTEATTVSRSHGLIVRKSISSTEYLPAISGAANNLIKSYVFAP